MCFFKSPVVLNMLPEAITLCMCNFTTLSPHPEVHYSAIETVVNDTRGAGASVGRTKLVTT